MNDFGRLAVGIVMLGLAIWLSSSFDQPADPHGEDAVLAKNGAHRLSVGDGAAINPEWEALPSTPGPDSTNQYRDGNVVRPVFDPPPSNVSAGQLSPPVVSDRNRLLPSPPGMTPQYQPLKPFQVVGVVSPDAGLVPVQPKPSFTGSLSRAAQLHKVVPGESLQSIARDYYGNPSRYLDIYLANKHLLANPDRLPLGIELRIPE